MKLFNIRQCLFLDSTHNSATQPLYDGCMQSPITLNFRNPFKSGQPKQGGNFLSRMLAPLRLKRSYQAAKQGRLTADWLSSGSDLNNELKSQLSIIRTRAREQEQNSNIARSYFRLCETHIVGPDGFTLSVQAKDSKGVLLIDNNAIVEADFKKWAKRGVCELTGKSSLRECERVSVRTTARDGECLIRMHDVSPTMKNPWGFVIELLDPARLDHLLNQDLSNGNRIRLGIELNKASTPVAYWLRKGERSGLAFSQDSGSHERVLANDMVHFFDLDRPEQLRGASWIASAMLTIHMIDAYKDSAVTAARAGAAKMGFIVGNDNKHATAESMDEDGQLYEHFEAGMIGQLNDGASFESFDPKYPHELYGEFLKENNRSIASGLGVSYHALTGDITDVNFSSIRSGTLEEREQWKVKQDSFSCAVMERIYLRWLVNAALVGRFSLVGATHNQFLELYSNHRWQGRRWSWVDPLKDIKAVVEAINSGLTSPERVAAEYGVDLYEVLEEISKFQKTLKEKDVNLPVYGKPTAGEETKPGEDEDKKDAA